MTAKKSEKYVDLDGKSYSLTDLDSAERALLDRIRTAADKQPDWGVFDQFWMPEIDKYYSAQGLSRREIIETTLWEIAQDLSGRLGIAQGEMRSADYRDELAMLINTRFATRREFCEATGLSEDMLSHVLAKRKNLAIDTLSEALAKIGYTIHIAPLPDA